MNNPQIDELFYAVSSKKNDLVESYLKTGNVDVCDKSKRSLLHHAVMTGNADLGPILIKHKIDLNLTDDKGMTALHYSADKSDAFFADLLVKNGSNISISDKFGNEPLWKAMFNARGKYEIVRMLMSAGANPNHFNTSGKSPLDFANTIKDETLVAILLKK